MAPGGGERSVSIVEPPYHSHKESFPIQHPDDEGTKIHFQTPGTYAAQHYKLGQNDEVARQDGDYCIDELCECGLHKCPPTLIQQKFDATTTYRTTYDKKMIPERLIPEPFKYQAANEDRTFTTESRANFDKKMLPEKISPSKYDLPKSLPFDATTTYRTQYGHKLLPEKVIVEPSQYKSGPEDRDFNTQYRANYKGHIPKVCQVTRLPAYPAVQLDQSRSHTFWDNKQKRWY